MLTTSQGLTRWWQQHGLHRPSPMTLCASEHTPQVGTSPLLLNRPSPHSPTSCKEHRPVAWHASVTVCFLRLKD